MSVNPLAPERFEKSSQSTFASPLANLDRMDLMAQLPYDQTGSVSNLPNLQLFDAAGKGASVPVPESVSDANPTCHSAYVPSDYGAVAYTRILSDKTQETDFADGTVMQQYPYGSTHIEERGGTVIDSDSGGNTSVLKPDGTDTLYDHCGTKTLFSVQDPTITTTFADKSVATSDWLHNTVTVEYDSADVTVPDPNQVTRRLIQKESDGTIQEAIVRPEAHGTATYQSQGEVNTNYRERPNGDLVLQASTNVGDESFASDEVVLKKNTLSDGTKTYTSQDGSAQIRMSPDKTFTLTTKFEDGEYQFASHPDGSYEQSLPDGGKSRRLVDGTYEIETPNDPQTSFTRVHPDGSIFYRYTDGSTEALQTDGTATTVRNGIAEQQRITMTLENGDKVYPDFRGEIPSAKMPDGSLAPIAQVDNDHIKLIDSQGKEHIPQMDNWSDTRFLELENSVYAQRSKAYIPQAMSELSDSN